MKNSFTIYAVLFGAYAGISLPLPILGPLILGEASPFAFDEGVKYVCLSLALAAFPIGHLIGAPLLGSLSDRFGKKRMLQLGLCGGAFFYALSGIAIWQGQFWLLVSSRILSGLFEGNAAIAQSILTSVDNDKKTKVFGSMVAVISVGYVMGPVIGSCCQTADLFAHSSSAMPFFVIALFLIITMIFVAISFIDEESTSSTQNNFRESLAQILRTPLFMRMVYFALLLAVSRSFYIDFLASFLKLRFDVENATWIWTIVATIWAIAAYNTHLGKRFFTNETFSVIASTIAGIALIVVAQAYSVKLFLPPALFAVIGLSIMGTLTTVSASEHAPPSCAGLAMGLLSSTYLFGEIAACLAGGPILALWDGAPLVVAGILLGFWSVAFAVFVRVPAREETI